MLPLWQRNHTKIRLSKIIYLLFVADENEGVQTLKEDWYHKQKTWIILSGMGCLLLVVVLALASLVHSRLQATKKKWQIARRSGRRDSRQSLVNHMEEETLHDALLARSSATTELHGNNEADRCAALPVRPPLRNGFTNYSLVYPDSYRREKRTEASALIKDQVSDLDAPVSSPHFRVESTTRADPRQKPVRAQRAFERSKERPVARPQSPLLKRPRSGAFSLSEDDHIESFSNPQTAKANYLCMEDIYPQAAKRAPKQP